MSQKKVLYHYTSLENAKAIIASGHIFRTPSNLIRPRNLQIVNGIAIDPATDDYYPVVWMTDSESPEGHGIEVIDDTCDDNNLLRDIKKRVRISIPKKPFYFKWNKWARQHNADPVWTKGFTHGCNWQSWYVSELEIPLENISEMYDRETNTLIEW